MSSVIGLLIAVIAMMFLRLNRMEERYLQIIADSQQAGSGKGGYQSDPYLRGQVKNTVTKHYNDILSCYSDFLERNKTRSGAAFKKEGAVTIDWEIETDGSVLSPGVVRSDLTDAEFHACLTKKIASWQFPEPPYNMKKYVEHTFKFQDAQKK